MTIEETIKYFKEMVESQGAYELCPCFPEHLEMARIALKALEKQAPKKPKHIHKEWGEIHYIDCCPVCGKVSIISDYCEDCGQRIEREGKRDNNDKQ